MVFVSSVFYYSATEEIPAHSFLYDRRTSTVRETFPSETRIWKFDPRLRDAEVRPYWSWSYDVVRDPYRFRYGVTLSVMGSPEQTLRYLPKLQWRRPELTGWACDLLRAFEREHVDAIQTFRCPLSDDENRRFGDLVTRWFSIHAKDQGITLSHVTTCVPDGS